MPTNAIYKIVLRYVLAAVSVSVALLFTRLLRGIGDFGISPLFFAAVLLTAWYGGFGPGLLATLLSGVATASLLLGEHGAGFSHIGEHILRVATFSVVAILASSLHVAMKSAAEASLRAKEAAETASEAKSRFLAMVSHELRTPLSPVLILTEMLEHDPALPARLVKDVRAIRRNVDLEIRLIEDLVDLTRINIGKLRLKEQLLDLCEPLDAAIQVCRDDMRDKQLGLTADLSADRTRVAGDPVRLQQVFWNLLRNAIKFTPEGGRISVRAFNDARETVTIEISDTGIGIDPQRLSRIFTAFEQGEPDIQIRFGGLGLGLAICQALVEAHHGTIRAASEGKNHGAKFFVTLPVVHQRDAPGGNGAANVAQGRTSPSHGPG
jgi:signal transduction histidine kinase